MMKVRLGKDISWGMSNKDASKIDQLRWRRRLAVKTLPMILVLWVVLIAVDIETWALAVFGLVTVISLENIITMSLKIKRFERDGN
jgi:hypothetical protein